MNIDLDSPLSVAEIEDEGVLPPEAVSLIRSATSPALHRVLVHVCQDGKHIGSIRWSHTGTVGTQWLAATVRFVNEFQDMAIEHAQGIPLPKCNGHSHPMSFIVAHNSELWWQCPRDGDLRERLDTASSHDLR